MKLALISGLIAGATLALAGIGYITGIVARDEALMIVGALAIGAYIWNKLEG